jgi:hypothetical protein
MLNSTGFWVHGTGTKLARGPAWLVVRVDVTACGNGEQAFADTHACKTTHCICDVFRREGRVYVDASPSKKAHRVHYG